MRGFVGSLAIALAAECGAATPRVEITSPVGTEAVFGEITLAAEVQCDEAIEFVDFLLDGKRIGRLAAPPFRVTADAGSDNVEHLIRVTATTVSGTTASTSLVTPRIQVDDEVVVELQQLYVTATKGDRRVLDLQRGDFTVLDDGAPQSLVTFARGDVPFSAVILLDASASMAGEKMRAALDGARAFTTAMRPLDEARLIVFSDRLLARTPFLGSGVDLLGGISVPLAQGGTALNDHLFIALQALEQRQGRRVVIILSDGMDSHSVLSIDDTVPQARRARALVYWLRITRGSGAVAEADPGLQFSAWRDGKGHRRQVDLLERTVVESGASVTLIEGAGAIGQRFQEILAELRDQYVLGYYPSNSRNDGRWHDVEVRARRGNVKLRTALGYTDF